MRNVVFTGRVDHGLDFRILFSKTIDGVYKFIILLRDAVMAFLAKLAQDLTLDQDLVHSRNPLRTALEFLYGFSIAAVLYQINQVLNIFIIKI